MAATVTFAGTIKTTLTGTFANALDLTTVEDKLSKILTTAFTSGTGANKAQVLFSDERTLLTTTDETLDLMALTSAFGVTTLSKIKAIVVSVVTLSNGYRLQIGGAAANAVSGFFVDPGDILEVQAGSTLVLTAPVNGYAVDATHKDLKISNPSGGSVTYDIYLIGEGSVA